MRLMSVNAAILETLMLFLVLDCLLKLLRIFLLGMVRVMGRFLFALHTILEWQRNKRPMIRVNPVQSQMAFSASVS
jgi:hypothetical protein